MLGTPSNKLGPHYPRYYLFEEGAEILISSSLVENSHTLKKDKSPGRQMEPTARHLNKPHGMCKVVAKEYFI